jgi:hypothetical protein
MNDNHFEIKYNINFKTMAIAAYYDAFKDEIKDEILHEVCDIIAKNHILYVEPAIIIRALDKQEKQHGFHLYGVALLHPEDVFDEETGMRIARRRLRSRYRTIRNEILRECWRQISHSYTVMKHNIAKCIDI